MFRDSNWDEWIERIGLRKRTKNKKVEVVNLEQMSPEEVKKHIFGAIKVEDEEEHVQPLVRFTSEELYTPTFNNEEEQRLNKLRKHIAETAEIPFGILYGGGGEGND